MAKAKSGDTVATLYAFDETVSAFVARDDWTRDNDACARRLFAVGVTLGADNPAAAFAIIAGWSDADLQAADCWALGKEGGLPVGDFPTIPSTPPDDTGGEATQSGAEGGADTSTQTEGGGNDTVADDANAGDDSVAGGAGNDTVAGDGPTDTLAGGQGDDTVTAGEPAADPGAGDGGAAAAVDPGAGEPAADPVGAQGSGDDPDGDGLEDGARECLTEMRDSRYGLYRYPGEDGRVSRFGASGPQFDGDLVRDLVDSGHAEIEESGGQHGSVKITDKGRAALRPAPVV